MMFLKSRFSLVVSLLLLVGVMPTPAPAQPYGITSPVAINPFLNGTFPPAAPNSSATWDVEVMYTNVIFDQPMFMTPYLRTNWEVMVEKTGLILMFPNRRNIVNADIKTFLDLRSKVFTVSDSGMTGLAFHPEFGLAGSTNRGFVYVTYKWRPNPDLGANADYAYIRLSRFTVPDGQLSADPTSEQILLQQLDLQEWHDAGCLMFGLDGLLYFSIGDEGGANDQYNVTQVINQRLMSGIFRIDVNNNPALSHPLRRQPFHHPSTPPGWPESYSTNYYVPNDNPFVNPDGSVLEEYYALGLRNAYRFSQDAMTGRIWIGDVGQDTREEVDVLVKGANYQWAFREGAIAGPKAAPGTVIGTQKAPLWDYPHANGEQCIIGGYVYRGARFASLLGGKYICCDNGSGRIWAITSDGSTLDSVVQIAMMPSGSVYGGTSSCGQDETGEIYFLKFGGVGAGQVFRLKTVTEVINEPPALLSQTGAFADLAALAPAPGLHPYTVNTPLWSDAALKKRWLAVPNNGSHDTSQEKITFNTDDEWQFPPGTVFVKHFELPIDDTNPAIIQRLETRFLMIGTNGAVYGLTYKWRADGSDADLLYAGLNADYVINGAGGILRTQTWQFPSRQDCLTCHNANAKFVLGVKTHQLNCPTFYPATGVTDNQLRALGHIGLFTTNYAEGSIAAYPRSYPLTDLAASLEMRVRSYIDANCAQCHRPGGVQAYFDARFSIPLDQQNLIFGPTVTFVTDLADRVVVPGDAPHSMLFTRPNRVGNLQMPPLARNLIDSNAVQVINAWINSLPPGPGALLKVTGSGTVVSGPFSVQVQFTTPISGLNAGQFNVSNGNVISLNGGGINYTLVIAPQAEGEVTAQLPAGQVTDGAGHPNYASNLLRVNYQSLSAGLVTWLLFDEGNGTTAADGSGNGNNGLLQNLDAGAWVTGLFGDALSFNGVNSYVLISNVAPADFTLACWIRSTQTFATVDPTYAGTGIIWSDIPGAANDFILGGTRSLGGVNRLSFFVGNTEVFVSGTNEICSGNWTHLAATRNRSSGEIKIYVNGKPEGSAIGSTNLLSANAGAAVGGNVGDNHYFQGLIDDVRIYSRVLGASEVLGLFNLAAPPVISAIPDVELQKNTSSAPIPFTVSGGAVPAGSLTLAAASSNPALIPQANIVFGGAGSNRTVAVSPALNQFGSARITITVDDGQLSASSSFNVIVIGNLVAWYKMESNLLDSSGNNRHGTGQGGVGYASGKVGLQALALNGTTTYAQIPLSISNDFTIAFWAKTTGAAGGPQWFNGQGLVDGEVPSPTTDFGTALVGNQFAFGVGNPNLTILSTTAINNGAWHHLAATRNGTSGEMALYVDGVREATAMGATGTRTAPPALRIGSLQSGVAGGFFAGSIDDVKLFDYVVPSTRIAGLINSAPVWQPVSNRVMIAGATLTITNGAIDAEAPPQVLSYSLLGPTYGASLGAASGVFSWRPLMAQAGSTYNFSLKVTDDAVPSLSATQALSVLVQAPARPELRYPFYASQQFSLSIAGDAGPDYTILESTNLIDWSAILTTNPLTLPFTFSATNSGAFPEKFYRVKLGP